MVATATSLHMPILDEESSHGNPTNATAGEELPTVFPTSNSVTQGGPPHPSVADSETPMQQLIRRHSTDVTNQQQQLDNLFSTVTTTTSTSLAQRQQPSDIISNPPSVAYSHTGAQQLSADIISNPPSVAYSHNGGPPSVAPLSSSMNPQTSIVDIIHHSNPPSVASDFGNHRIQQQSDITAYTSTTSVGAAYTDSSPCLMIDSNQPMSVVTSVTGGAGPPSVASVVDFQAGGNATNNLCSNPPSVAYSHTTGGPPSVASVVEPVYNPQIPHYPSNTDHFMVSGPPSVAASEPPMHYRHVSGPPSVADIHQQQSLIQDTCQQQHSPMVVFGPEICPPNFSRRSSVSSRTTTVGAAMDSSAAPSPRQPSEVITNEDLALQQTKKTVEELAKEMTSESLAEEESAVPRSVLATEETGERTVHQAESTTGGNPPSTSNNPAAAETVENQELYDVTASTSVLEPLIIDSSIINPGLSSDTSVTFASVPTTNQHPQQSSSSAENQRPRKDSENNLADIDVHDNSSNSNFLNDLDSVLKDLNSSTPSTSDTNNKMALVSMSSILDQVRTTTSAAQESTSASPPRTVMSNSLCLASPPLNTNSNSATATATTETTSVNAEEENRKRDEDSDQNGANNLSEVGFHQLFDDDSNQK